MAHFLTHGVTRERLEEQIRDHGGYHVVHWSGHGHLNLLELAKPGGKSDHLSGQQLLELFADAGGFLPRLVVLSACHSGDILRVKDWSDFLAIAQGKEPGAKETPTKQLDFDRQPGFTGTAHALLQGGVPSVVAMRYAERLAAVFDALQHQNMTLALAAGSRAVVYCVQAEAWDRLGGFASQLVTSRNDPRLLDGLIPHLRTAAESAPEGKPRWSCLCYLADALESGGRPDASLPFYEQAATLAHAAAMAGGEGARQAWVDLAWITGNWANALGDAGDLNAARQRHLEAADASKQAGRPAVDVIASELEVLRIDIMQGNVAAALPQIETRLAQVAAWWQRHRSGQSVPEAPDAEILARAYISALDIAEEADDAREDWESSLRRFDTVLDVKRALERPAEDIGATRFNRATVLTRLGRFGEARSELEACLQLFQHNPAGSSKVLNSLADLFSRQGDVAQAITQQRRALALRDQLPDPAARAISHNNLANYLERHGTPSALAESPRHRLAALIYFLVAGLGQHLQTSLRNYAVRFRRARAAGAEPAVPRVADLLADPAFHPLAEWLRQRQVALDELQSAVDQFLAHARQLSEEN